MNNALSVACFRPTDQTADQVRPMLEIWLALFENCSRDLDNLERERREKRDRDVLERIGEMERGRGRDSSEKYNG